GRRRAERIAGAVHADRIADGLVLADRRMLDRTDERASGEGAQRLANSTYERCRDQGPPALSHPLRCAGAPELALENADQRPSIRPPPRIRGESRIVREVRAAEHLRA